MSTITQEQQDKIAEVVNGMNLSAGLGDEKSACSIAAINLALIGELTDNIPKCMSEALGRWIIRIQDALLFQIRNSKEWKSLLPLAAGTGNNASKNEKVIKLLDEWVWNIVTEYTAEWMTQSDIAEDWKKVLNEKTEASAQHVLDKLGDAMKGASPGNELANLSNNVVLSSYIVNYLYAESLYIPSTFGFHDYKSKTAVAIINGIDVRLNVSNYMYDYEKGLEFWTKLDVPGLLKRMIEC